MFAAHRTVPLILTTDAPTSTRRRTIYPGTEYGEGYRFHHSPQPDRIPGQCRAVWETPPRELLEFPGIYKHVLLFVMLMSLLLQMLSLHGCTKNNVQFLHFWHPEYPETEALPGCTLFLCYRGNGSLNHHRQVAIVGTRHAPHHYGQKDHRGAGSRSAGAGLPDRERTGLWH